jgi:hypothetical protein
VLALLAALQVADVFEQLATTVADSTQASIAQLMTQQQEVSRLSSHRSCSEVCGWSQDSRLSLDTGSAVLDV